MCDTMGFLAGEKAYFAKNSDRSPNEAQVVEYHPAHRARGRLKTTYVEIDDREDARAVLLSHASVIKRPVVVWPNGQLSVGFDAAAFAARAAP